MNVVVAGAGENGIQYAREVGKDICIQAFVDNDIKKHGTFIEGVCVYPVEQLVNFAFDKLVLSPIESTELMNQCLDIGVSKDKIELFGWEKYAYPENDARVRWLSNSQILMAQNKVSGNVAECGVNWGHFAYYINKYFPDRTLYLFDTFDGFDENDLKYEKSLEEKAFLASPFADDGFFGNINTDMVLMQMPHPEKCIIKKGYFPESAKDVDGNFCFVNLDMDLYKPMLAALHFFWNRMADGGIILLHDYFHDELPGVKTAVDDFESESGFSVPKTPIGDFCSIAITKV